MGKCIPVYLIFMSFLYGHAGFAEDTSSKAEHKYLSIYMNSFSTAGEVLSNFEEIGIINETEMSDIVTFLKMKKIGLDAKISKSHATGKKILWGNSGWSYTSANGYVSEQGVIIDLRKMKSMSELFIAFYGAQVPKKSSFHIYNTLVKSAYARGGGTSGGKRSIDTPPSLHDDYEDMSIAFAGLMHAGTVVSGDIFFPFVSLVAGVGGAVLETVMLPIHLVKEGSLKCAGDKYEIVGFKSNNYFSKWSKAYNDKGGICNYKRNRSVEVDLFTGHATVICATSSAGLHFLADSLMSREVSTNVSQDVVVEALKPSTDIKCTSENATLVHDFIKKSLGEKMRAARNEARSKRSQKLNGPAQEIQQAK